MKYLKLIIAAVAVLMFASCEKLDITVGNIWGEWYEYYDSDTFSMDDSIKYTFSEDGTNGELFVSKTQCTTLKVVS